MVSPFRDRVLSPDEVRRVVQRAAEFAEIGVAAGETGQTLTASEVERRLRELGISADVVRRAMEHDDGVEEGAPPPLRLEREVVIDGVLHPETFERISDAIAAVMKMEGLTSVVGNRLTWIPGGVLKEPMVSVQSKDGRTRIRFAESATSDRQAMIGRTLIGGISGAMSGGVVTMVGVAIAKSLEIGGAEGAPWVFAAGGVAAIAAAIGSFVGMRRATRSYRARRAAFAEHVVAQVCSAARECVEPIAPKVRVEEMDEANELAHEEPALKRDEAVRTRS